MRWCGTSRGESERRVKVSQGWIYPLCDGRGLKSRVRDAVELDGPGWEFDELRLGKTRAADFCSCSQAM
jgi:hypothetical protein